MSIFEENLKALSAVYPQMDQLIKEAKEKIEPEIEIIEETSYSGERIIKIKKERRGLKCVGEADSKRKNAL